MSYAEALLLTLFTAIVSVIATSLVRRALGVDTRREHHEVGNPVYLQIGVVFAVLLAFVFNEVFGEYNAAAQAINGECGALHGAALLAHQLPDRHGRGVEEAILNYSKVVISDEWPALQHREASSNAVLAFQAIVEAAGNLSIGQPNDGTIQGQILSLLAQAHAFRETRIFQANQGLPIIIWLEPISKSFEEDHEAGELDEAEEVLAVVLPADEDAALPLDPGEEAFDEPTSHVTA